jgi:D-threo-aldose 1-dehydrogenase
MPKATARVPLGRTGLKVSRLALGTAPLGNLLAEVAEDQAEAVLAAALDAGMNYIDTAPYYGYGLAEERVGRALQGRPRGDLVISTKVGRLLRPGLRAGDELNDGKPFYLANPHLRAQRDYSYDGTLRSLEESLVRLGTDHVDIVHIHDPDDHFAAALSGAYPALARLREQGVIRGVSAGMNQWEMLSDFMDHGVFDTFLLAGRYTLLDQSALHNFMPECAARGVAVIAGGVFNSGLLADPRPGSTYNYVAAPAGMVERALRIRAVCDAHGLPLKAAALQFPLGARPVASILTGVRSADELAENLALFETPIPAGLWADLMAEGLLHPDAPLPEKE